MLKSGSAWTNRVFYGIDLVKNRLLIADTSGMLSPYARAFNYYMKSESDARYLQSITGAGLDNVFSTTGLLKRTGAGAYSSITDNSSNWNTAFSWGNHASAGYELASNKATTLASPDNTKYPTTLAITSAGFLTQNQSISFSPTGDVTGSASGATSLAPALTIGARKVLYSMMPSVADGKLLGRSTGSAGDAMEIAIGSGLSLSGGTLSTTGSTGEANTASNLGSTSGREGIFASKVGVDLQFKSLVAGTNISFSSTASEITISNSITNNNQLTNGSNYITQSSALSTSTTSTQDGYFGTVKLKDVTNPSHYLTLDDNEDLTANHSLHISTGNADRTLTLNGNTTLSGTNTGDQTIALSNDVSGLGTASISATVNGLKGVALPSLGATAGLLKYTGTGTNTWVFDNSTYLTGNQSISFAPAAGGDVTGSASGSTSIAPTLVIGAGKVTNTMLAGSIAFSKLVGSDITLTESQVTNLTTDLASKQAITTVATGLTAAGTNQSTALALTGNNSIQEFTTVAASSGGKLPTATATSRMTIVNRGANTLTVYPNTSGTINGQAANTGYTIPAGGAAVFVGKNTADWYTEDAYAGGDLNTTDGSGALTIGNGKVTLAMQASLAANSIIGNNTGSSTTPIALSILQVRTMLSINNVENTALSTWTGSTSITTVGTIATGTWSATAIAETKGGTNQTTYTLGDILYASASNTLSKLAGNTSATKMFIVMTGTGTVAAAPGWGTIAAGDVPTLNQNTTGQASNITGVLNAASFPALSGDVTTSSGSLTTAIGSNKVLDGMIRQSGALAVIGRSANSAGNVADISAGVDNQFLSRKASVLGFNAFGGQAAITAASAGVNTTETILTSYVIPASTMIAGTTYRATVYGTCTSSAVNASNIRLRLGTAGTTSDAAVAVVTPTAATSGTSVPFQATLIVTIRSTGSGTGTTVGAGWLNNNGVTGISSAADVISTTTTTSALNTTVQNTISLTYSSAATTTTSTFQIAAIEIVKM
jgi:hypothetical protein